MKKRMAVLLGIVAVLLVAVAPAFAQGQYTATGVLERSTRVSEDPEPVYAITDEETDTSYELISGFVELEPFVGERVLVYGVPGVGGPLQPDGSPRALNVTEVVPLGDSGEVVTVTFELDVDGEVPEGQTLALRLDRGSASRFYEGPSGDAVFCATDGNPNLPACEDGGTYSGTLQVPADEPIAFEYVRLGDGFEVFYSDTRSFEEDATVRATYTVPEDGEGGSTKSDAGREDPTTETTTPDPGDRTAPENGEDVNEDGSIDETDGEIAATVSDAAIDAARSSEERTLPATGGVSLLPLLAGLPLAAGGLLLVRRTSR